MINFLQSLICYPGKIFCKKIESMANFYFLFLVAICFSIVFYFPLLSWFFLGVILWLCLGLSLINHFLHKEKTQIIEGILNQEKSSFIRYAKQITPSLLFFVNIALLATITLFLWKISFLEKNYFSHDTHSFSDWGLYTIDLIFKAVFFDIPEIYNLNLTDIRHQGFIGGTLVFVMRMIVLVLVMGSILHWVNLRKTIITCLQILEVHPDIARTKLLLVLQMYPRQIKFLIKQTTNTQYSEVIRANLVEILGLSKRAEVLPHVQEQLTSSSDNIKLSALKALEHLKTGDIEKITPILSSKSSPELLKQTCSTLGSWNTKESVEQLQNVVNDTKHMAREFAISALGKTDYQISSMVLVDIIHNKVNTKEERFAAKDALLELQKVSEAAHQKLNSTLLTSKSPANRRFSAMVLGGIQQLHGVPILLEDLQKDTDQDTRYYCVVGLGQLSTVVTKETLQPELWKDVINKVMDYTYVETYELARAQAMYTLGKLMRLAELDQSFTVFLSKVSQLLEEAKKDCSAMIANAILDNIKEIAPYIEKYGLSEDKEKGQDKEEDEQRQYTQTMSPNIQEQTVGNERIAFDDYAESVCMVHDYLADVDMTREENERTFFPEHLEVQECLWSGERTIVWLVEDLKDNSKKVYKHAMQQNDHILHHEIEVLQKLKHDLMPQIAEVFPEIPGFAMNYFTLNTLQKEIENYKSLPVHQIIKDLCSVVAFLHSKGYVHCDIKPCNILCAEGKIQLLDFGGVCALNSTKQIDLDFDATLNATKQIVQASPPYMAPEILYKRGITEATDVYSLGILTYECLCGKRPCGVAKKISDLEPDVPPEIQEVLAQATAYNPNNRYRTVEDFWDAMDKLLLSSCLIGE